jgi:hypothetical protein
MFSVAAAVAHNDQRSDGHHSKARHFTLNPHPSELVWIRSDQSRKEGSSLNRCLPSQREQGPEMQRWAQLAPMVLNSPRRLRWEIHLSSVPLLRN